MAPALSLSDVVPALAAAVFGYGLGWGFFRALRVNADWYLASDQPLWRPLGLHALRFLAVTGALGALTTFGWLPPLAALTGLTVARVVAVRPAPADKREG